MFRKRTITYDSLDCNHTDMNGIEIFKLLIYKIILYLHLFIQNALVLCRCNYFRDKKTIVSKAKFEMKSNLKLCRCFVE